MSGKENDEIEWDVAVEILLFYAMVGHKPVGVNRYFMMASIHDKFSNYINRQITSKPIWDHLDTMYDMAALHESEIIPFPNDEVEFELPSDEFDEIAMERLGIALPHAEPSDDVKTSNSKSGRKSTTTKPKQMSVTSSSTKAKDVNAIKPSTAASPLSLKLNKGSTPPKSGQSSPASDSSNTKSKSDPSTPVKGMKPKQIGSPVPLKTTKPDSNVFTPVSVESSPEIQAKKASKPEANQLSPNKGAKQDTKKANKQDLEKATTTAAPATATVTTAENGKKPKEINASPKKSSLGNENPGSKRNSKGESNNIKKKSDNECTGKKTTDMFTNKGKLEVKNTQNSPAKSGKSEETDNQNSIGTGMATRTQGKNEPAEVGKKRKRLKNEDSSRKTLPVTKRRRT